MASPHIVPGLAGVPIAESAVSYRHGEHGILEYRGYPLTDLVERSDYLETAFLLLYGDLPLQDELSRWRADIDSHRRLKYRLIDLLKCLPGGGPPMACLQSAVSALRLFYPDRDAADAEADYWSCVRLLGKVPTILAAYLRLRDGNEAIPPRDGLGYAANFLHMLRDDVPARIEARTLDACLMLHAEHTMNCSTFSARVAASALASPYAVASAAMATLSGPLIGGAPERFLRQLREIGSVEAVLPWLEERVEAGGQILGFGDVLYASGDPRTRIIRGLVRPLFEEQGETDLYRIAMELARCAAELLGEDGAAPNVDFYSALIYSRLGVPDDAFTCLFAWARTVGWLAHWQEQIQEARTYRPTQIYVGPRDRVYEPLDRRSPR